MSYEVQRPLSATDFTFASNVIVPANAFTVVVATPVTVINNPRNKSVAPLFWIEGTCTVTTAAGEAIVMQGDAQINGLGFVQCFTYQQQISVPRQIGTLIFGSMVTMDFLAPGLTIPAQGSINFQSRLRLFTTAGNTFATSLTLFSYGL